MTLLQDGEVWLGA